MKSFFMLLFTVSSLITGTITAEFQETETVEATYAGYVDGEYHFATADAKIAFQAVDEAVTSTVDLSDKALVGQKFIVSYVVSEDEDEGGEVLQTVTIVKLTPAE